MTSGVDLAAATTAVRDSGQPVLTGPTFIDASNVAAVAKYAAVGNR